jgi:hypothetical protein
MRRAGFFPNLRTAGMYCKKRRESPSPLSPGLFGFARRSDSQPRNAAAAGSVPASAISRQRCGLEVSTMNHQNGNGRLMRKQVLFLWWGRIKNPAFRMLLATALSLGAFGPARAAPPVVQGVESLLLPGLGQFTNGDREEATAYFGVFAASVLGAVHYARQDDFLDDDKRFDDSSNRELINRTTLKYDYAVRLASDMALYSSYAAYRDARIRDNSRYRMSPPHESLADLAVAPFSFRYLSRPTTFIPLAIQAVGAFSKSNHYRIDRFRDVSTNDLYAFNFAANEMTAVGEEALFRGFLDTEFSDRLGNAAGLAISSAIFGLSHNGSGQTANVFEATGAGFYLGWLHQRNGFEAGEGVALHFWFNVLAGIGAIRNGGSAQLVNVRFSF